jgi:hypothetical protein
VHGEKPLENPPGLQGLQSAAAEEPLANVQVPLGQGLQEEANCASMVLL